MIFLTGITSIVKGFSAKEALGKFSPDGKFIADITLGVGDGSEKYPTMWVNVPVWEKIGEKAVELIDKKGIPIEATGMLQVRMYEGKRGKTVAIELKNVHALKIYDRDGNLIKLISNEITEEIIKEKTENGTE
jgi:single-stranded DNA-binding protein